MPARLRRPVEASLRSNREASRATLAVTRLHQRAKRHEDTSTGSKLGELKELRDPDILAAMTPRQLSLVAWSLGKLRDLGSDLGCAREDLLSLVASRASDMDAQGLSMTMWSFASLRVQSHVRVVVRHALAAMSQMSAQGVSNTLWACASLRQDQEPLLQLAEADVSILSKLSTCFTQAAANVIWATARLSEGWAMQRTAAQVAEARAPELRAEEAAAVLWALAVAAPAKAAFEGRKDRLSVLTVVSEHALRQLHPKSLAASAWAFATLAETGPFWTRFAAATSTALRTRSFSSQELAHTCWAFATVVYSQQMAQGLWTDLGDAVLSQPKFSATELAAVSWSMAAARFTCPGWSEQFPEMSRGCKGMNLRALASVAWSWTTLTFSVSFLEDTVMPAASSEVRFHLEQLGSLDWAKADVHRELLDPLLQLAWAFSFAKVPAEPLLALASSLAVGVGRRWDLASSKSDGTLSVDAVSSPDGDGEQTPRILLNDKGILFLHKPPGWEVDGGRDATQRPGSHPQLSSFLRERSLHPVLRDLACGFGFLGRLDLPSEGIVLAATTYQAYYALRMQQETLALEREYIMLCHGQIPWGLKILRQGIRGIPLSGSIVSTDGLPAETHILPCAWLRGDGGEVYTLVAASIVTGRKHQIRVHLSHQGYPVVGDHRYGSHESQGASPPGMSCRQFLFRYRIAVLGLGENGEALQMALPLAPDLRTALQALKPLDRASASAWQQWTSRAKPLAFRELELRQKMHEAFFALHGGGARRRLLALSASLKSNEALRKDILAAGPPGALAIAQQDPREWACSAVQAKRQRWALESLQEAKMPSGQMARCPECGGKAFVNTGRAGSGRAARLSKQYAHFKCTEPDALREALGLLKLQGGCLALVFCNNEATVEKVAEQLGGHSQDYGIIALHEQMPWAAASERLLDMERPSVLVARLEEDQ
ncbi:Ribosomal large subunit pseudouridine synthase C [Symbiodinium microadriaticum]|uniref:Ribosomal large subunit pseudouridine synthase C n=1 Tax=Symbiodinium microadriaticum TaxID=2951 RepID=A0A1Q9DKG7_SYMMI|nr:Ribosomal large subunit pseudouridine synthase C [Symbiodinium microadriaticum]CAE7237022.1 rluC [Symbiodinium microadriaticum]